MQPRRALEAVAATVLHVGEVGSASVCKVLHNCAVFCANLATVECLTAGVKAGVDAKTHLTPELLRRPGWLVHANGAEGVCSLTAVVADPSAVVDSYRKLFGAAAVSNADDRIDVWLEGGQSIRVIDAAGARQLHPGMTLPGRDSLPCLVAMTLRVQNLAATVELLTSRQIAFVRDAAGPLRVPASEACGVVIEFSAHGWTELQIAAQGLEPRTRGL